MRQSSDFRNINVSDQIIRNIVNLENGSYERPPKCTSYIKFITAILYILLFITITVWISIILWNTTTVNYIDQIIIRIGIVLYNITIHISLIYTLIYTRPKCKRGGNTLF